MPRDDEHEDEPTAPRRRRSRYDDDENDDRPRRRYDEEDDDRPRRKSRRELSGLLIAVAVTDLVLGGIGLLGGGGITCVGSLATFRAQGHRDAAFVVGMIGGMLCVAVFLLLGAGLICLGGILLLLRKNSGRMCAFIGTAIGICYALFVVGAQLIVAARQGFNLDLLGGLSILIVAIALCVFNYIILLNRTYVRPLR